MPPEPPPVALVIRRAREDEGAALADLYLRVRRDNAESIPPVAHTEESVREWWSVVLPRRDEIWVAERAGETVGVLALRRPDWLDQLYVVGPASRRGVGSALLEVARRELGGQLQLWTFQANAGARRFYERHGFVAVEQTDGDNEEGAPDVRYLLAAPALSRTARGAAGGSVGRETDDATS